MTAINAVADKAGAFLMTDAAAYDENGIVTGFTAKCYSYPHLRAVMAVTGTTFSGREINSRMANFESFEDMLSGMGELVQQAYEEGTLIDKFGELSHVRVLIAGWSEENKRGEVYAVTSGANGDPNPFTLIKRDVLMSPGLQAEDLQRLGFLKGGKLAFDDPADFLEKVIADQRMKPFPIPGFEDEIKFIVGGSAVLTVINAAGITQRVVLRWADKIGEPIDPDAVATPAAVASLPIVRTLSRHERRAAEAKQRKAG